MGSDTQDLLLEIALAINSSGRVCAGSWFDAVFRSTDNWSSWTETGFGDCLVGTLSINSSGDTLAGVSGSGLLSQEDRRWGGGHGIFTHYLLRRVERESEF